MGGCPGARGPGFPGLHGVGSGSVGLQDGAVGRDQPNSAAIASRWVFCSFALAMSTSSTVW